MLMHFIRAMSGAKTHRRPVPPAATTHQEPPRVSGAAPEFPELWKNVSKLTHGKTPENRKSQAGSASPRFTGLQSPKQRPGFTGGNASDSPGEMEPSQDIIWDSTSPTHATSGFRCTKVEISDLVNRIAPKDVKPHKSSLLQWIGDSAVPCTPDLPKHRPRKRSSRPNSVDDLMKLARQFDENMQQDKDLNENLNIVNNNRSSVDQLSCDSGEAELRALFDGATQRVSGPLSQGSTHSAGSQEVTRITVMPSSHKTARAEESSSDKASGSNKCDDFDDDWDWENDELLNDSLLMAITQEEPNASTKISMQSNTKCIPEVKPSPKAIHAPKSANVHSTPSYSALQALCPKPKTTNRSTFKLGPDPFIRPPTALTNQPPEAKVTGVKFSSKTQSAASADDFSHSLWDDEDDALLYQVCDSVERISNTQPHKVEQSDCHENISMSMTRPQKTTTPVPITATATTANKPPAAFMRSKSFPTTSGSSPNYQGWDRPMSSSRPQISQSFPGNHTSLGSFNSNTVRSEHKPSHSAFKRNVSDSAVICKKVFVTSEAIRKCSAAEIEKKKQEALARRRQRVENSQKT